ncbi:MAG: bifunctional nuclease family protein [Myxococcaceae bacterium]
MLLLAPLAALGVAAGTLLWMPGAPSGLAGINNIRWPALAAPASASRPEPSKMVELEVHDVIPIEEANTHAVVLISPDGESILPLFVTEEAAVSIAFRLAEQKSPHPLAADLLDQLVTGLGAQVREVRIDGVEQDIYTSHVIVRQRDGKDVSLDARPSDAIAMALTGDAKIVVTPEVLKEAGITREEIEQLREHMGIGGGGPQDPLFPLGGEDGGDDQGGGRLPGPSDDPIKL